MLEYILTGIIALSSEAPAPEKDPKVEEKPLEEATTVPEELTVEIPPQDQPQLSLRAGMAIIDERFYELLAPSFTISGLSIEVRYHRQSWEEREEGDITLKDVETKVKSTYGEQEGKATLTLKGKEKSIEHQLGFNFGWDFPWRVEKRYLRLVPSVHLMGGMEAGVTKIKVGEENLPREVDLNFFVGLGTRGRLMYPISHKIIVPVLRGFELGLGLGIEYRRRDLRDIGSGDDLSNNSYALEGYFIITYIPDKKDTIIIPISRNGGKE